MSALASRYRNLCVKPVLSDVVDQGNLELFRGFGRAALGRTKSVVVPGSSATSAEDLPLRTVRATADARLLYGNKLRRLNARRFLSPTSYGSTFRCLRLRNIMATTQRPPRPAASTGPDLIWPAVQFGAFTGEYNQFFYHIVVCL